MEDLQKEYRSLRKRLKHLNLTINNARSAVTEQCQRDLRNAGYQEKLIHLDTDKIQETFPELYHESNEKLLDAVHDVLVQIEHSLPLKDPIFSGHFVRIGSFRDGTKTSSVNEFDFLYVLDSIHPEEIRLERTRSDMICKVYKNDQIIGTDQLFMDFSKALLEIGRDLRLPEGLEHGGFGWPRFSGVRYNEPAITYLFVWNGDPKRKDHLISVDLTTALQLPMAEEKPILHSIREKIRPILRQNNMIWYDLENKIHLVPIFPEEDEWYITTAQLEAELLHPLSGDTPVKTSIKIIKTLNHDLISGIWEDDDLQQYHWEVTGDAAAVKEISAVIEIYQNSKPAEQDILIPILGEILSFAHVLLPSKMGDRFKELAKTQVSLNTAAIKNLALLEACNETGAFRHTKCQTTTDHITKFVITKLASGSSCTVPHMLLPYDIKVFSVAGFAADDWFYLMTLAKEQCKAIANALGTSDYVSRNLLSDIRLGVSLKNVSLGSLGVPSDDYIDIEGALTRALEGRKSARLLNDSLSEGEDLCEDDDWDEDYEEIQFCRKQAVKMREFAEKQHGPADPEEIYSSSKPAIPKYTKPNIDDQSFRKSNSSKSYMSKLFGKISPKKKSVINSSSKIPTETASEDGPAPSRSVPPPPPPVPSALPLPPPPLPSRKSNSLCVLQDESGTSPQINEYPPIPSRQRPPSQRRPPSPPPGRSRPPPPPPSPHPDMSVPVPPPPLPNMSGPPPPPSRPHMSGPPPPPPPPNMFIHPPPPPPKPGMSSPPSKRRLREMDGAPQARNKQSAPPAPPPLPSARCAPNTLPPPPPPALACSCPNTLQNLFDMESDYEYLPAADIRSHRGKQQITKGIIDDSKSLKNVPFGPGIDTELFDNVMDYMRNVKQMKPDVPPKPKTKIQNQIQNPDEFRPPPNVMQTQDLLIQHSEINTEMATSTNEEVDVEQIMSQVANLTSSSDVPGTVHGTVERLLGEYHQLIRDLHIVVQEMKHLDPVWPDDEAEPELDLPLVQVQGLSSMWIPHNSQTRPLSEPVPHWDISPESFSDGNSHEENVLQRCQHLQNTLSNYRQLKRKQMINGSPMT